MKKLAEALLRRKELEAKVRQLAHIKNEALFDVDIKRVRAQDGYDDITARVPKLTAAQVTEEHDYYANKLRLIDAAIQQTNWTAGIEVDDRVWVDYLDSKPVKKAE